MGLSMKDIVDRSNIDTEQRNQSSVNLHNLSSKECIELMIEEDLKVQLALKNASHLIEGVVEDALAGFSKEGRLIYIGAGTSGRLGVLDASEAPPTFYVDSNKVCGIIAGGDSSLRKSSESKEDDFDGAVAELKKMNLNSEDTLVGIASGGTTPYVHGALSYAKTLSSKPLTVFISCSDIKKENYMDHLIYLTTGPEVLTGSTRLKAGTATKMALNILSTTLMVKTGRVYKNYMVDMKATNEKLIDRALRIICDCTELKREKAYELLMKANKSVKTALVMEFKKIERDQAEYLIERAEGFLNKIIP
jgi:N-acetylmuramic acid 6-phosphate etherase